MRVYLKEGDYLGSVGYTDIRITKKGFKLSSIEGAELSYYDEDNDEHHTVLCDMDGNKKTNPNFGKYYYETE